MENQWNVFGSKLFSLQMTVLNIFQNSGYRTHSKWNINGTFLGQNYSSSIQVLPWKPFIQDKLISMKGQVEHAVGLCFSRHAYLF